MKNYEVVSFIQHDDHWHFGTPPPRQFLLSDRMLVSPYVELTQVNLWTLLYIAVRNPTRHWKWRLERCLYRVGFLDPELGAVLSWRHDFRWRFWRTTHGK